MRVTMILLFGLLACSPKQEEKEDISKLPKLDRIHLVDLEGEKIDLNDYKGKRVFINFWATWCKPCITEMPDLSNAYDSLSADAYVFLAASDESIERIEGFAAKYDFSFQFVKMENSIYDLEIPALPASMVIDKEGNVVFDEIGVRDWDSEEELKRLRAY